MPAGIATPVTLGTTYADNGTLGPFQEVDEIIFQFTGGPVAFQFGTVDPSGAVRFDNQEIFYPPGAWAFRNIKGIRFRSIQGQTAVTLSAAVAFFADDPEPFTPGNVPGSVSLTSTLNFQHNDIFIASEPTIDFEDGGGLVFSVTDDNANSRIKVAGSLTGVVTSVFGRTGIVTAQTGDYVASQVTNAADLSNGSMQTFTGAIKAVFFQPTKLGAAAFSGSTITGAPTSGTWSQGEFIITYDGNMFICTAAGTPGTWTQVGAVDSVFGRTGNVTAQAGDYTAAQVTNAADKASSSVQTFAGPVAPSQLALTAGGSVSCSIASGVLTITKSAQHIGSSDGSAVGTINGNHTGGFMLLLLRNLAGANILFSTGGNIASAFTLNNGSHCLLYFDESQIGGKWVLIANNF